MLRLLVLVTLIIISHGFRVALLRQSSNRAHRAFATRLYANTNGSGLQAEASMSVDELKAELEMRSVDYDDCISKNELVSRLVESRAKGKADPELLKKFKEMQDDQDNFVDAASLDDTLIEEALGGDETLPGGMDPATMKALASDPQIMNYLKDPKMGEIMEAVMTGGPDAIKKYLSDPDAMKMLQALSTAIAKAGGGLGGPPPPGGSGSMM